jgi:maltose/moltooligosaccharide transporter
MEPFRAFVGDLLPPEQRKVGFAMQSVFIGAGAVLSSLLLTVLAWFGVEEGAVAGAIPNTVHIAFYIGAAVFITAVLYTIVTTREHPPADVAAFKQTVAESAGPGHAIREILGGIMQMPLVMRRLAVVQFFTWLALFCMWIYFTPAIARSVFQGEPGTPEYLEAVKVGGRCFAITSAARRLLDRPVHREGCRALAHEHRRRSAQSGATDLFGMRRARTMVPWVLNDSVVRHGTDQHVRRSW